MQEALKMIAKGRPQDAAETLSAALEAPTISERDAALAEAEAIAERCRKERETLANNEHKASRGVAAQSSLLGKQSEAERIRDAIRARRAAPARRMLDAEEVREALSAEMYEGPRGTMTNTERIWNEAVRACGTALGLDLDAAPARCNACGHAFHDDNACSACRPGECIRSDS